MKIKFEQCIGVTVMILALGCSGEHKLFERKVADSRIKATKGYFSGIHYLTIEKLRRGTVEYKLIYDCECDDSKMSLTKYDRENQPWYAVTDSTETDFFFFDQVLRRELVSKPFAFEQVSEEQKSAIKEAISKTEIGCCSNPDKSIDKIMGFVKRVPLKTNTKK